MRSKRNVDTLTLQDGEYLEKQFNNYADMATSAVDWTILCSYELKPNSLSGVHKILSLPNMQIAYTHTSGAIMYDFISPLDTVSLSVIKYTSKSACIGHMKLNTDDIVILDSNKKYTFMYNAEIKLLDLSIKKSADTSLYKKLSEAIDKHYFDSDKKIAILLENIIEKYSDTRGLSIKTSQEIEAKITQTILNLVNTQDVKTFYFNESEKITIKIREQIFNHMDAKIEIASLAKEYNISERSLQKSFKVLFGFTPNQFLRLLKLNLTHHELIQKTPDETTVLKVASKWGFTHVSRFSKFYTELFLENPSATLKREYPIIDGIKEDCVGRKEEI